MNKLYGVLFLLALPLLLWAQDIKTIREKAEQGDSNAQLEYAKHFLKSNHYEEFEKWLLRSAKQNNESAQTFLGAYYHIICKDYNEAMKWFLKAGEQGSGEALYTIGCFYLEGKGVDEDAKTAFQYFKKAAECGDPNGMCMMGVLYLYGNELIEVDVYKAADYFKTSAILGSSKGQYMLALCYLDGLGVTKDREKAIKWLTSAVEQGSEYAKEKLEELWKEE